MWNFIKSLLSNRFGIVLATLNLCYLVYISQNDKYLMKLASQVAICANSPAFVAARIFSSIPEIIFYSFPLSTFFIWKSLMIGFFVISQWLFIGWLSRTIAQKFNKDAL